MCYSEGIEYFISNVFRVSHFADGPLGLVSQTPAHLDQCILHGAEESLFWGKHTCNLFTTSLRMKKGVICAVKNVLLASYWSGNVESVNILPTLPNCIAPVCPFNSLQSQMSSIFFKRMRSCRNPEKLNSRTGAIFTVHDATSMHFVLRRNSLVNTQFNGMEWTFWPRHAHCELRIFLWRIPWRGL